MMIGIIGAMDEEVLALQKRMDGIRERKIANTVFYVGVLHNKPIVLLRSGIGKVNAAISTTLLCEHYPIQAIINMGTAGGLSQRAHVLDLVIATEVVYFDVDVTGFGYSYGQVPQMPSAYTSNEVLVEKFKSVIDFFDVPYHVGLVVSGDSFIARADQREMILSRFPEAIAVEMEGAAIAQVAYIYRKPFIIIRALSDIAGKKSSLSFSEFLDSASKRSADLVSEFIGTLDWDCINHE